MDTALIYRDRYGQCQTEQSRRLPCHGAEDVSLGLVSRPQRFPSCSLLIRWSSWLCRSCISGTRREETVEIPLLQPVLLDPVVRTPVVCNDRCRGGRCPGSVHRRFSRPVITQRRLVSGSAPDSVIAGDSGHSSCATEKGTRLSACCLWWR